MNYNIIPTTAFILKQHTTIKYQPEIPLYLVPYNSSQWQYRFPHCTGLDLSQLQLTNISLYSMAIPQTVNDLITFILELNTLHKFTDDFYKLVITEANGGVGGFSIKLVHNFRKVNIVEINKINADILMHNLSVYNAALSPYTPITHTSYVTVYNTDYLDILFKIDQDIIVFDMPWYGPKYKQIFNMKLGLNNVNIWYIINELFNKNKFKAAIFMAPINFDMQNFITHIISRDIIIKKMDKHYLIAVLHKSK